MLHDSTLEALNFSLQSALESSLKITSAEPVSGGCINQAFKCQTNQNETYFIKLNTANKLSMFEAEARGLEALKDSQAFEIPNVIALGKSISQSYLILNYLALTRLQDEFLFGQQLAQMHSQTAPQFGFDTDNFIGATPQRNTWHDNWFEFFMQQRLDYQCDLLEDNQSNQKIRKLWPKFRRCCENLFADHQPVASLLHGDLWQGNVAQHGATVCIFDPATYYGDAETDLAMLVLFGSPSSDFYRGYESLKPIAEGHAQRRVFYNLYHVLNHSNLFGSSYSQQAFGMMQQIIQWDVN